MAQRYYRAICTKCGATGKSSDERRWLDPFFCPDRCPECGDQKSQHASFWEKSGWRISYGYWRTNPRPVPFSWFRPSTWLVWRGEAWIDFDEEHAALAATPSERGKG